jgi:DNA topoisomerase-3
LPIVPEKWKYNVTPEKAKLFGHLKTLMLSDDVDTIVNACDAGREGEYIFGLVYRQARCKKSVKRLWVSSMEEAAIRDAIAKMKPGSEYENLYSAADCRAKADWLVGVNVSRLFSCLYPGAAKLNFGRVQTPTLTMIVERDKAIAEFVKTPFYVPEIVDESNGLKLSGSRYSDKSEADAIAALCNGAAAAVISVKREDKSKSPPKLYDLTSLQRDMNREFGRTATETLDAVQQLYEKQLSTYPRVDSCYVTDDMADTIIALVKQAEPNAVCNVSQVINNAKVTDHHAIIPTVSGMTANEDELLLPQRQALQLLKKRLVLAVGDKHVYSETELTALCAGNEYKVKGKMVVVPGWLTETDYDALPNVTEGYSFPAAASVHVGETTPPKAYTEDTLLRSMETAGNEDMPDDAERTGLGTPATRASIIELLIKRDSIRRITNEKTKENDKGKSKVTLEATKFGKTLVAIAPPELTSAKFTSDWECFLSDIAKGKRSEQEFMQEITDLLRKLVAENKSPDPEKKKLFPKPIPTTPSVGNCPKCGSPVYWSNKKEVWYCFKDGCKFALYADNNYWAKAFNRKLDEKSVKSLITEGKVTVHGAKSKSGSLYDAVIWLNANPTKPDPNDPEKRIPIDGVRFEFADPKSKTKSG